MSRKVVLIEENRGIDSVLDILIKLKYEIGEIKICHSLEDSFLIPVTEVKFIVFVAPLSPIPHNTATKLLQRHFLNTPLIVIDTDEDTPSPMSESEEFALSYLFKSGVNKETLKKAIETAEKNNIYKIELKHSDYKVHFYKGQIPMWIYDTETLQILEVNNAALEKYGYRREEFLTLSILDIHPREDVESFIENHENREELQFDNGYWRHKKKNEEIFFVNIYTHYAVYDNRETGLSFAFDVNDKLLSDVSSKNSKNLKKGQKEQFDSILSTLSDAVWSIRADTQELIYANQAFYNLFGFTPEEMTANIDPFFSLIHPEDQKKFRHSMQSVSYKEPAKVEYRYNHNDGNLKIFQAHVALIKGGEGKPDTLNGVTVDVTKERVLQDKIRKSEQNLLATIDNTKDFIWSVNTNLEIIFCNKPYQDYIFLLTRVVPRPGDYVLGEWGSESFINTRKRDYERALSGESFVTVIEDEFGGQIMCKEFSNNPIRDHDGKIIGVSCNARDITEQKRQFLQIQEQNDKLREIAWIQSHRVRSPVATILGLIDLVDYEEPGDNGNMEILKLLKEATIDLDKIIREVVEKTETLGA